MNPQMHRVPVPGRVPFQAVSRAREGPVPAGVKDDVTRQHFIQSSTSRRSCTRDLIIYCCSALVGDGVITDMIPG